MATDEIDDDPRSAGATALRRRIGVLGRAPVIRHPLALLQAPLSGGDAVPSPTEVIGICASTGGPQALAAVLEPLPASFPIPIVVVQHITSGFTDGLAVWLDGVVALPVGIAVPDRTCEAGVWLAPDGGHLSVTAEGVFAHVPGREGHVPSGDVLLDSLAISFRAGATGVVLTGMGRDGARGVASIAAAGGLVIAQDEASSAVFGMPKAALEAAGTLMLPLERIGARLALLAAKKVIV
jgi:two-component system chemotaxis response regulator CheB